MLRSMPSRATGQGLGAATAATLTHGLCRIVTVVGVTALMFVGIVPASVVLWFCLGLVCAAVCLRITRVNDAVQVSSSSALSLLTGAPRSEAASLLLLPPSHSGLMHLAMLDRDWLSIGGSLLFGSPGKDNRLREHDLAQLKTHVHSLDCKHCSLGIGRFSCAAQPPALPSAAATAGHAEALALMAADVAGNAAAAAVGSPRYCPPGVLQQQQQAAAAGALASSQQQQQQRQQQLWDSATHSLGSLAAAGPVVQPSGAAPAWLPSSGNAAATYVTPVSAAQHGNTDRLDWLVPAAYNRGQQQPSEISVANGGSKGSAAVPGGAHAAWGSTAAAAFAIAAPASAPGPYSSGVSAASGGSNGVRASALVPTGSVGALSAHPAAAAGSAAAAAVVASGKAGAAATKSLGGQWPNSSGSSAGLAAFQAHQMSLCESSFHKSLMQAWGSYSSLDGLEDASVCSICLGCYHAGALVTGLPCGHLYHKECVMPWLLQQGRASTCPMCKADVFA